MNKYETRKEAKVLLKRIGIGILITLPIIIVLGFILENKVSRGWRIFLFVFIFLAVTLIQEYIYAKIKANKDNSDKNTQRKDVFK